jgi:hypothetical protein
LPLVDVQDKALLSAAGALGRAVCACTFHALQAWRAMIFASPSTKSLFEPLLCIFYSILRSTTLDECRARLQRAIDSINNDFPDRYLGAALSCGCSQH